MTRIHLIALGMAAGLVPVAVAAQPARPSRPNVVLIVADDLGYGEFAHPHAFSFTRSLPRQRSTP